MFARYYLYLDHSVVDVAGAVAAWAGRAGPVLRLGGGQALLRDAGMPLVGVPIYDRMDLEVGAPTTVDDERGVVMPVRWQAHGGPALLADVEGDLTFEPYGTGRTQMTLSASYRAPAGQLGELLERGLVQRLADAVIRDCAIQVGAGLHELLHAPPARTPGRELG